MNNIFGQILDLIKRNEVMISDHGYDELAKDDIYVRDVVASAFEATVLEDYPQ